MSTYVHTAEYFTLHILVCHHCVFEVVIVLTYIDYRRFQPTQEEREMYKNYTGDKNLLPLADIFLLKVCVSIFLLHFMYTAYIPCAYEVEEVNSSCACAHTYNNIGKWERASLVMTTGQIIYSII